MAVAGPAVTSDADLFSVYDGTGNQVFYVRGDGLTSSLCFDATTALSSDAEIIYSDGNGGLTADRLIANDTASTFLDLPLISPGAVTPVNQSARLYYNATDGALHVRTYDRVDHLLTWTTKP